MEKPDLEPEVVAEVVAAEAAPERGKLLTRREAAERLGISETTLRRRERDELKPIVVDGVHMFEERQVRSVTTLRRQVGVLGAVDGGVAADVFELLREGVPPVEIVVRLRVAPEVVRRLFEQWSEMAAQFVVPAPDALRLGVKDAAELAALIAQVRRPKTPDCYQCFSTTAPLYHVCTACLTKVQVQRRVHDGAEQGRVLFCEGGSETFGHWVNLPRGVANGGSET
jgi:DNA-binding Lrp family transcriptional regulator